MSFEDDKAYLLNHGWSLVEIPGYDPITWKHDTSDRSKWPANYNFRCYFNTWEAVDLQRTLDQIKRSC